MDERRWEASFGPRLLLNWLRREGRATRFPRGRRKLRLFALACCRRLERLGPGEAFRDGLRTLEEMAEGRRRAEPGPAVPAPLVPPEGPAPTGLVGLLRNLVVAFRDRLLGLSAGVGQAAAAVLAGDPISLARGTALAAVRNGLQ